MNRWSRIAIAVLCWAAPFGPAAAHHSYALFDTTRLLTVDGVIAKLELVNPHGVLWVYVPNPKAASGYDLYAFENGPVSAMARVGWDSNTFKAGEKISVDYVPLKDGGHGGHLVQTRHADGRVTPGDPGFVFKGNAGGGAGRKP